MPNNHPYLKVMDCVTGIAAHYDMSGPELNYAELGEWLMETIAHVHTYYNQHTSFLSDPPCIHVDAVMLAPDAVDKETVESLLNEIGNPY